ncbi:hypothetical protein BGZ97_002200 [Linnemannia gamsii]|uniref:Uncharacterized protein n=1 Tax=Linnemannia gamsii TaxID=64522 RepID=A0A9P6RFT3_9FUNG|nr:hypothetical protein BGZ97_002200 [Linnemannia gamsii]
MSSATTASTPIQKRSKLSKKFLFGAIAVVAVTTLATPVAAGKLPTHNSHSANNLQHPKAKYPLTMSAATTASTPIQKRSKLSKKFLFGAVTIVVVAVTTLAIPVAAGFRCSDSQACANYCFSIGGDGGYCGGSQWRTFYCNTI